MRVCVIGLGYIGLPTAVVFARAGLDVLGVDVSERAVEAVNAGRPHIVEPGLGEALSEAVATGRLRAATEAAEADAFIVAVPTPFKDDHVPDLSYIEAASKALAPHLRPGSLVILESTSPVGATERMAGWLAEARPDLTFPQDAGEGSDVRVCHCPERVLPGRILQELVENDRVAGGMTPACAKAARDLYARVVTTGATHLTDARTAEMAKLTENAFRDVNIAFANELSLLADRFGVDVWRLIEMANKHPRVNILTPGPGVGGHCIAVDPWFLVDGAPDLARLIRTAREVNDGKPGWVLEQVRAAVAGIENPTVACLGLAFKPDVDDLRESPALEIACALAAELPVVAVEPHVRAVPPSLGALGGRLVGLDEALRAADLVLILVGHSAFEGASFAGKPVIDTRGPRSQPGSRHSEAAE